METYEFVNRYEFVNSFILSEFNNPDNKLKILVYKITYFNDSIYIYACLDDIICFGCIYNGIYKDFNNGFGFKHFDYFELNNRYNIRLNFKFMLLPPVVLISDNTDNRVYTKYFDENKNLFDIDEFVLK